MRLSDAGLRRRPTKLIDPDHRLSPWLTEDATRDRSNRLLDLAPTLPFYALDLQQYRRVMMPGICMKQGADHNDVAACVGPKVHFPRRN